MASPHVRSNGATGPRPKLPAFCRSRRPVVMVTASSIANLRLLVLLGLLFQLSTLLLVITGPVPPRLAPATVTSLSCFDPNPDPSSALNGPVTSSPISDR
ncbi:hypothetical protein I1E95_16110 [Synechococcus sp. CBW1107]|uniref:hypothetical protein n=1 Tax=Synechococcus sp. CBW1107 TaxID=2789857 RepID=UPI0018CF8692|nr:hypothetical protein [Synechococcus sp. CBW1107]QPN56553.1 hypothetical protein I1E95_16110 [Synechococcus sp. CBW1107]